jgi:hypothetical protein
VKANTTDLIKFKKLQRRLKESVRGVVGLLEMLWQATAKNCPQGDIGKFGNEDIAIMVDWDGDPDELVAALVECRWLDSCDEHRLLVHDWHEHCPQYVRGNLAKSMRKFANLKDSPKEVLKESPKGVLKDSLVVELDDGTTKPNLTKPNLTKPLREKGTVLENASKEFQAQWQRWKLHCMDKFKALGETAEEAQLIRLFGAYVDEEDRIAAIKHSISMNWDNVNINGDHKRKRDPPASNRKQRMTDDELFSKVGT